MAKKKAKLTKDQLLKKRNVQIRKLEEDLINCQALRIKSQEENNKLGYELAEVTAQRDAKCVEYDTIWTERNDLLIKLDKEKQEHGKCRNHISQLEHELAEADGMCGRLTRKLAQHAISVTLRTVAPR